jgi:FTR1 family protein
MVTTALVSFREFFEAFLIVGVFLGISKKLKLKKEVEIGLAATLGLTISLFLATGTYLLGSSAHAVLTEENAEILEGYLLIFSGFFIAYVVFSLHTLLQKSRDSLLSKINQQVQEKAFDVSLFFSVLLLVLREGFEVALFTASTSLFAEFIQNFIGLIVGFLSASALGFATFMAYIKFPIAKVFKITEYMIILLGAALVQNGVNKLLEHQFGIELEHIFAIPLTFLPDKHGVLGHLIRSFTGLDRDFSLPRLAIMVGYIGIVYLLFLKPKKVKLTSISNG